MNKGLLIVFSGPSGVGKGTVLAHFLAQRGGQVCASISATTRAPRPGEQDGAHYHFISHERFAQLVETDGMLEWAEYSGNCYGTPREAVEDMRARGIDVVLEIEVQGAMKVKQVCPDALMIFVLPPSVQELKERLAGRGTEDATTIARRMSAAREELARAGEYEYIVINDNVEDAAHMLGVIIDAAKCSVSCQKEKIDEVQKQW